MIQTLITAHSTELQKNYNEFILDYPMGSYIPALKIFRSFSNENSLIANHICSTNSWEDTTERMIMDIGGGDGLVLKKIFNLHSNSCKVLFVEPNEQLLNEAEKNLSLGENFKPINKDLFSLNFKKDFTDVDLALLVHVLYLLESNSLTRLMLHLPKEIPIIVVTDENDSIFPDCWSITATKYAKRSQSIHNEIKQLVRSNEIKVKKSTFKTYLKNPFQIEREDLRESLLSMITYSEFSTLSVDSKIDVKCIFDKYSERDLVHCNSVCYEIIKR